jgi:hypothetical protein
MPEDDAVEKVLADERALEDRRKLVIDDLLRQKADAIKAFDEKLAKLGYKSQGGRPSRSHHKQVAPSDAKGKPKA